MEKEFIKRYINRKAAIALLLSLSFIFIYALYINDWTASSYYYTCEQPSPATIPPSCIGYDENGNEVTMYEGDIIGTPPHPNTKKLTTLFYITIVVWLIMNHIIYVIKKRKA